MQGEPSFSWGCWRIGHSRRVGRGGVFPQSGISKPCLVSGWDFLGLWFEQDSCWSVQHYEWTGSCSFPLHFSVSFLNLCGKGGRFSRQQSLVHVAAAPFTGIGWRPCAHHLISPRLGFLIRTRGQRCLPHIVAGKLRLK